MADHKTQAEQASVLSKLPIQMQIMIVGLAAIALIVMLTLLAPHLDTGVDWFEAQRPATRAVLRGQSPYSINGINDTNAYFFNPPWTVILLLPIAILPPNLSYAVFVVAAMASYIYAAVKMGMSFRVMFLFLLSPPVLMGLVNANIDWLVVLGFALPPQIGLFFISVKPQMALMVGVFWLYMAFVQGGIKEVVRVFGPFTLVTLLSFVVFGVWPLFSLDVRLGSSANASLWPVSIPFGLVAMAAAIKERKQEWAMLASPLLTPYLVFHSYVGALLAAARSDLYMIVAVIGCYLFGVANYLNML
jgi:hypothetical protein